MTLAAGPTPELPPAHADPSAAALHKRRRGRVWWSLGIVLAVGVLLAVGGLAGYAATYRSYRVPTATMAPTVAYGDEVVVSRSLGGQELHRGDLVLVAGTAWQNQQISGVMVRRIVGVSGDTVACCNGANQLLVDGRGITEEYLRDLPGHGSWTGLTFSATVPPGRFFVLGDQRNDSVDSRVHLHEAAQGSIPRSAIMGKVVGIRHGSSLPTTPATAAFTAAGFPRQSTPDTGYLYAFAAIGIGAALAIVAAISMATWAVITVVWRRRPSPTTSPDTHTAHQ